MSFAVGAALAQPAKLDHLARGSGYNYEPPAQPSGLYELPTTTTTTTTTTTPPPPPPPVDSYLPPVDEEPEASRGEPAIALPDPPAMDKSAMPYMPYNIGYGVDDEESGNRYSMREDNDGQEVTGEYSVLLPDGRTQVVSFRADPVNGYTAEVTYV